MEDTSNRTKEAPKLPSATIRSPNKEGPNKLHS
jgi:hypothetical protein